MSDESSTTATPSPEADIELESFEAAVDVSKIKTMSRGELIDLIADLHTRDQQRDAVIARVREELNQRDAVEAEERQRERQKLFELERTQTTSLRFGDAGFLRRHSFTVILLVVLLFGGGTTYVTANAQATVISIETFMGELVQSGSYYGLSEEEQSDARKVLGYDPAERERDEED